MEHRRRAAERRDSSCAPIAWGEHASGPLARGALVNISASGVLFRAESGASVQHGKAIRTIGREVGGLRRARVVRVEHHAGESDGVLVACRWITGDDRARSRLTNRSWAGNSLRRRRA